MTFKYFFVSNIVAILILMIFPFKAASGELFDVILLNITFIFFVACAYFPFVNFGDGRVKETDFTTAALISQNFLNVLLTASIIGFGLILYDRIFLRNINYLEGLRSARYAWLASESGNIYGVTGNLLSSFAYVGLFLSVYHYLNMAKRVFYIFYFLMLIIGFAALNGGRSNLLLVSVIWIFARLLAERRRGHTVKLTLVHGLFALLLFGYIVYISNSSAELGGVEIEVLAEAGIHDLYGVAACVSCDVFTSKIASILSYLVAYLYHGQWIAQISLGLSYFPGNYLFESAPLVMLRTLLGAPAEAVYFEGGVFISLPGAAYYDYGYMGVFFVAILLGVAIGVADFLLRSRRSLSFLKVTYCCVVFFYGILSPIAPAHGFSYFSYVLFSFLVISFLSHVAPRSMSELLKL